MNKPQPSVSVQFGSEWKVRRPYLYRYLEKEFVDSFFENGTLRLSSFFAFSKHKDEARLDSSEGKGIVTHVNSEGEGQTIFTVLGLGVNSYVMSTSLHFSPELESDFNTDSGFRINDIFGFCNAISRHIPGFQTGLEGPCFYLEERVLDRDMGRIDIESWRATPDSKSLDLGKVSQSLFGMAGDDLCFLKTNIHSRQVEYRLMWNSSIGADSVLDIHCPEARTFCSRFEEFRTENRAKDS